ncbi:MAG: hypothetical protein J6P13_06065 [Kiritimatiellae bacterium]|nr:hypothetical protein [Kiritimatiellia bacterium]
MYESEEDRYVDEFGERLPIWKPLEPENRLRHKSFASAAKAAIDDLTTVRDPFMDSLADLWASLFPGLPVKPGHVEDGTIFLYVPNAPTLFGMRPKLPAIKRRLAELPGAPKKCNVILQIKKSAFAGKMLAILAAALALGASGATFTRPLERVNSLDPIMAQAVYDSRAVALYAETPLEVDYFARPYRLKSGLCELPQVSEDGRTYVLRMVEGAPLDAADVVRALERLRDPKNVSPGGWTMKAVDTIEAPDPKTVRITLRERLHVFPWMLAMAYAGVLDENGEGTGPYRLKSWRKNHEMVFEKRPEWRGWRDMPGNRFDTVRYLVIDDVSTQWLMFLKGEVDFLGEISRDNWDAVVNGDGSIDPKLAAEGVKLISAPSLDIRYIGFNMHDKVLGGNAALRRALTCAFDFPAWKRFHNGRIDEASTPVPKGVDGHLEEPSPYTFDLERAKAFMVEAGYPGGIDPKTGRRLELTLSIGRPTQDSREAGELLASFFAKIGVKLNLAFHTWEAFLRAVNEGRTQMFMMGWVGDYPDAENFLQLFYSKNASPGANHSCYSSERYDRAYESAMRESDPEKRNVFWRECQRIIREDAPWIFTHFPKSYTLVRPRVGNYLPSAFPYGGEKWYEALPDTKGKATKED